MEEEVSLISKVSSLQISPRFTGLEECRCRISVGWEPGKGSCLTKLISRTVKKWATPHTQSEGGKRAEYISRVKSDAERHWRRANRTQVEVINQRLEHDNE